MNRNTGSSAEMLAMALRDNGRATLIGETSAGALFGKDLAELKDGSVILFRTEPTVLSPLGKDYSVCGLPADVECADKREAGRDAVLQGALRFIEQHVRP
jgi:carboxyl-terminal processing protease